MDSKKDLALKDEFNILIMIHVLTKKYFFSYVLLLQENMKRVTKIKENTQRIYIMHTKIQMYNSNRLEIC